MPRRRGGSGLFKAVLGALRAVLCLGRAPGPSRVSPGARCGGRVWVKEAPALRERPRKLLVAWGG